MNVTQEISILNVSVLGLSKEELQHEFSNLKKHFAQQNDKFSQEIFDYKRQLNVSESLKKDLIQEIENLQENDRLEITKLQQKIHALESGLKVHKENSGAQILQLESEICQKEDEIKGLKDELHCSKNDGNKSLVSHQEMDRISNENVDFRAELQLLTEKFEKQKIELNVNLEKVAYLEDKLSNTLFELDETKEKLAYSKEEWDKANQMLHTFQEDYVLLKSEMDLLKNNPSNHARKGNSLFAEVDDRRLQVQEKSKNMFQSFKDLNTELALKDKKMAELRGDRLKLIHTWEEDVKEKCEKDNELRKNYEIQIEELNKIIEHYKNAEQEGIELKAHALEGSELMFIENFMQEKRDEIKKLQVDLHVMSINKSMLFKSLHAEHSELIKLRAIASKQDEEMKQLRVEMGELKNQLSTDFTSKRDLFKCRENFEESFVAELKPSLPVSSILKPNMRQTIAAPSDYSKDAEGKRFMFDVKQEGKENGADCSLMEKKKVLFAEGTRTSTVNDRPFRRRGTGIEIKSIYVPTD